MAELHDLTAAYALDALDQVERNSYEEHLEACARCRGELNRLSDGATHLAESASQTPPAHLKDQIMDRIEESPQKDVLRLGLARPRSRGWQLAFAAAAMLAVVFAGLLVASNTRLDRAETVAAIYEAGDSVSLSLESEAGPAEFTYSRELGLGVFLDRGLAEPPGNRVYELWLVGESGPVPAGIFKPGDDVLVSDLAPGLVLAMTEEPAGGSDQPTGDILFTAEL